MKKPNSNKKGSIKKEKTFAQKNANVFERLALKIIEYTLNEKLIISKNTKATRDSGIDAIIKVATGNITIEAKLRKYEYRLGLKDVATSIIFYMLRMNRKHYIVSNVVFTNNSFKVIQDINKSNGQYCIECLCGTDLIEILKNIQSNLDEEEKFLAEQLINNICCQPNRSDVELNDIPFLYDWQECHVRNIINKLKDNKKCIIMEGICGIGKSYMANAIAMRLKSNNYNIISVDCRVHATIQQFFYKLSDELIGINVSQLIEEFKCFPELYDTNSSMSSEREVYEALWQILSDNYTDDIRYLASQYIQNLLNRFSFKNVVLVLDNFVNCDIKLYEFICDMIINNDNKLSVLIVLDRNISLPLENRLLDLESRPNNLGIFYRETIDAPNNSEAIEFIQSQYRGDINAMRVVEKFGTNLSLIKMILSELNDNTIRDISLIKPLEYSNICESIIKAAIYGNKTIFTCCCFILWVTGEYLDIMMLNNIAKFFHVTMEDIKNELLYTNLFMQIDNSITYANGIVNQIIYEIFVKEKVVLTDTVKPYYYLFNSCSMKRRAKIRLAYYTISDYKEFSDLVYLTIEQYKKLFETQAELETRYFELSYLSDRDEDDIQRINATANFLYSYIEHDYSLGESTKKFYDIEKSENYLSSIFPILTIAGYNSQQQRIFAESVLKFSLYQYFKYKRKNDFTMARSTLLSCSEYFDYCSNEELISRVIRFSAIAFKESGNRKEFFKEMEGWQTLFPNNHYLEATHCANSAADCCLEDPAKALESAQKAINILGTNYPYLRLWIEIDSVIYKYYCNQIDANALEIDIIMRKAKKLCSITDISRLENICGAIYLKNNNLEESRKYFGSAFRRLWCHEPNNIMLYLSVNYLSTLDKMFQKEYEETMEFLMHWLSLNKVNILMRINDGHMDKTKSKLIAAIKSITRTMNIMNNIDDVKSFSLPYEIDVNDIKIHDSFLLQERYIILF